jgi:hypothetical protein
MYLTPDGGTVTRKAEVQSTMIPAGRFRFLSVIVKHSATVGDSLGLWEVAQQQIDRDHASFAASRGLPGSIVTFDNTNLLVDASEITDPRSLSSIRVAAERKGVSTASYQFIASINLDPGRSEGGFAGVGGPFIYMGNYSNWSRPLTPSEWINVANAVYHHEVAHHWGWPGTHDWAPQCGSQSPFRPFIVPPILFGWEDVDGDRIPEVLDPTPYGRPG